jgi:putative transposase
VGDFENRKETSMTHHEGESTAFEQVLEVLTENGFQELGRAIELLMNEAMKIERDRFLSAAPYQRSESRRGHANGFKPKRVETRVGALDLRVPQVRAGTTDGASFYPQSLEKGVRSERALKLAIAEMYVQGVSTRRVEAILKELCGLDITSVQVSRAAQMLDEELEKWRQRPLGEMVYLILDARYEKVRHGGAVVSCALLTSIGVDKTGKRSILGVSVSLSEAEVHWREHIANLQQRGMHGVRLVVSDDHAGLAAARDARLPGVPWQRCQFHLHQNANAYIPRVEMRAEAHEAIRSIFNAADGTEAQRLLGLAVTRFRDRAPRLAEWMEANLPQGLTVFQCPAAHRRRLRTSNVIERLNRELDRRTSVATLFPNEASLLRLATAVVVEIDEEWQTGRVYLSMEN